MKNAHARSLRRAAMLEWTARIGAVTAEALAAHSGSSVAAARASLSAAERERLLARERPLAGGPALYTLTRAGLRAAGAGENDPSRVSAANAEHLAACAAVAAALELCYPDHRVLGERALRRAEQLRGRPLASARLDGAGGGNPRLHRPDLALSPRGTATRQAALPVAVEVELTVKAPRRLAEICRAWARCRCVAGVLYLARPDAERALQRAVEAADAREQIAVVALDALPGVREWAGGSAGQETTEAASA